MRRARGAEHEAQREHESTRRGARGAERARGEEHEEHSALSAKCGAEEHGARGTEHEARSKRHGARSTEHEVRGAEHATRRRAQGAEHERGAEHDE